MMLRKVLETIAIRPWLRIGLAVALIIVGLAPVGAPILSDSSWFQRPGSRAVQEPATTGPAAQAFTYRWNPGSDNTTLVYRSDDGSQTWHEVATIPQPIEQVEAVRGNEARVFARNSQTIWTSEDGGLAWSRAAELPSRPLSMAPVHETPGLIFVGTESVGLLRSNNSGASWQTVESTELAGGGTAPVGVTALAVNPTDEQILYAATGIWLGTSQAHFTSLGIFVSVDGGRQWFEMVRSPLGAPPVEQLSPASGNLLRVSVTDATGTNQVALGLSPDLLAALDDNNPSRRAAAARAIGLIGDTAALPILQSHLQDPDILTGDRIAEAIGRLGDATVIPALTEALTSGDEAIRARAAYALGLVGASEVVPELKSVLVASGPMAQRRAAEALANIGTPEALAALLGPLADAEMTPARHAAMAGLEMSGASAADPLTGALRDRNAVVRANAAEALGWLKPEIATPALAQALMDPEPTVRAQAMWALGEIGTPDARTALASALKSEHEPAARDAASLALARADAAARGGRAEAIALPDALLGALSRVPASRWSFMTLTVILAALLLWLGPRQMHPHRS